MRVLFTCHPGSGHFQPMVPLARALLEAGHEVAFATAGSFRESVEREGFTHHRAGLEWDESRIEETVPDIAGIPASARTYWILNNLFLDRSPRQMVPDLRAIIAAERPDLIVVNNYEMAGIMVAEDEGIPYVTYNISFRWSRRIFQRNCGVRLKKLRRELGFAADPGCRAYGRYLDLCAMPETWTLDRAVAAPFWGEVIGARALAQPVRSMQARVVRAAIGLDEAWARRTRPPEGNALYMRPSSAPSEGPAPAVLEGLPDQPTVYVSLGTVFNSQHPEVFDVILDGLRGEAVNVVMTVGADGDPARFGAQPSNVRIARYIPQAELLPHVDLCLNHGGFGTVMDPMALGIPQVILPLSADQPIIAMLGLAHGAAAAAPAAAHELISGLAPFPVVDPARLSPAVVRDVVLRALASDDLHEGARRMQASIGALPAPAEVVDTLVAIAARS